MRMAVTGATQQKVLTELSRMHGSSRGKMNVLKNVNTLTLKGQS